MGIQINGQTDTIKAIDGTMTMPGTVTYEDVSRINVVGVVTAASFNSTTGNVTITENANVMFQNSARDTNRGAIQFNDSGQLRIRSGAVLTETVRVSAAGSLGLTNSDPSYKISVKDTKADGTGVQMHLWNNSTNNVAGNVWSGIRFTGSTADYETAEIKGWRVHPGTGLNSLSINTGGVERMVMSSGGIGIGTDNPLMAVHIQSSNTAGDLQIDRVGNNANGPEIVLRHISETPADNDYVGQIAFSGRDDANNNTTVARIDGIMTDVTNGSEDGELVFNTRSNGSFAEKFRIHSSGEVTKPLNPRFHADRYAGGTETDQTSYDGRDVSHYRVEYNNTQYDIGGNFTTSGTNIGYFTAPVAGLYLFHASASIILGANWGQSWFIVNGNRVRGTDWVMATAGPVAMNSIQLELTAGATVGFHPYNNATGNTISGSRYHTWFKGCLLY